MACSRMALIKRGWGAKPASSNSHARAARHRRCRSAHQQQHRFEDRAWQRIPLATQPLRLRNSNRKGDSARPGLEPEPCSCEPRVQRRALRSNRRSATCSQVRVPASHVNRLRTLHYGKSENHCKMTISRFVLASGGPACCKLQHP